MVADRTVMSATRTAWSYEVCPTILPASFAVRLWELLALLAVVPGTKAATELVVLVPYGDPLVFGPLR